ncbi:hypothetical protein C8J57DRAFT_1467754 [Mycena rebaudengoi]|nr:hypothetical protein C8J57DRAFT_1467754 [Mycena rebaudengoi]
MHAFSSLRNTASAMHDSWKVLHAFFRLARGVCLRAGAVVNAPNLPHVNKYKYIARRNGPREGITESHKLKATTRARDGNGRRFKGYSGRRTMARWVGQGTPHGMYGQRHGHNGLLTGPWVEKILFELFYVQK